MNNKAYKVHVITPDEEEVELAQECERLNTQGKDLEFESLVFKSMKSPHFKEAFIAMFEEVAETGEVLIASSKRSLTSQEAADLLGVSRPYINKLLDNGAIPFHKTGTHRRVYIGDILEYRQNRDKMSRGLEQLTHEAQKNKLAW
jgi:excisionase family DNA binding protein